MSADLVPMSASKMTACLWFRLGNQSEMMIPRFTPARWWECDVFRLTKSGFSDEYEIKVSVADFRVDFKKDRFVCESRTSITGVRFLAKTVETEKKHDLLAARHQDCPNRFWFVLTDEVSKQVDVPEYAGLIVAYEKYLRIEKKAPLLHRTKFAGDRDRINTSFYYRYWNAITGQKKEAQP